MNSNYESHFQELCQIGSGGYSIVFKAKCIQNDKDYAIKKFAFKEETLDKTLKEINFLCTLNSDYIVEHIHSWVEDNYYNNDVANNQNILLCNIEKPLLLHIQMELCSMILDDLIKSMHFQNKNSMTPKQYSVACDIFTQLLECVQYLHQRKPPIIHRDLKPQNILLSNENRFVKLTDFGLSTYYEFSDQSLTEYVGTPFFKAPEVINSRYDTKVDIYSLGRIMTELFNIDVNRDNSDNVVEIKKRYKCLTDICLLCLSAKANDRPNCKQILSKKYLWDSNKDITKNLFCKIEELNYEMLFEFNFEKWPLITNIDLELLKNCKFMSIIEEIEKKAIFVTKDRKTFALRVSEHIDSKIQEPNIINELSNQEIKSIICGFEHVLCLTKDMRVYSLGDNETYISNSMPSIIEVLKEKRIVDIKCGAYHSVALSKSGRVFVWGSGGFGQCGNGETYNVNSPTELLLLMNVKIISISCGWNHCLALSESNILYGWGNNDFGQLGIGNNENQNKPIRIHVSDQISIKKVTCGRHHSLILTSNNEIYSFGYNNCGQLGIGSYVNQNKPIKFQTSIKFIDIQTTFYHDLSVGLSIDNIYYVWGECRDQTINSPKQTNFFSFNEAFIYNSNTTLLCQPNVTNESIITIDNALIKKLNEMISFEKLTQIIKFNIIFLTFIRIKECKVILITNNDMVYTVSLNVNHVLCLTEDYVLYTFGDNYFGELGIESAKNNFKTTIINKINNKQITDISCGQNHCLALSESGQVFVWGAGYYGQCGNGTNNNQFTQFQIILPSNKITSISCGAFHCLALSSNGELYGWGDNRFGQLGIGNNKNRNKPFLINNNDKIVIKKISCGYWHSILLSNDFNIYTVGDNSFGQLGIGSFWSNNHYKFVRIETSNKFIDIQTNWCDSISAALSQTGKYYIWGKCGDQKIRTPKQTNFTSFDAIFAKYSSYSLTAKQINLT